MKGRELREEKKKMGNISNYYSHKLGSYFVEKS